MAAGWQVPDPQPGPAPGLAFGGFGERLVAYIVDIIIVSILVTVVALIGGLAVGAVAFGASAGGGRIAAAVSGAAVLVIAILAVSLGYFPFFWARGGATPGMKMFNLYVVRDSDGGPISGGQAILRLFGYWVSSLVLYLGYIWVFVDTRRRGWHDLIAGTVVVQRK